jgi:hypothetical protein
MIIDMGGGTVDMTIHKVDTAGDTVSLSELTHRECEAEVSLRNSRMFLGMGPIGMVWFWVWVRSTDSGSH